MYKDLRNNEQTFSFEEINSTENESVTQQMCSERIFYVEAFGLISKTFLSTKAYLFFFKKCERISNYLMQSLQI